MKVTKQQARDFLENIKPEEKVSIVYHNDLDGFSSGIFLKKFLVSRGIKNLETFASRLEAGPFSSFRGDLDSSDKIIIVDLGPNAVREEIERIQDKSILFIDHHQKTEELPESVLEYDRLDEGYIPASRMVFELLEDSLEKFRWFSVLGVLSDEGQFYEENLKFLNDFVQSIGMDLGKYKVEFSNPLIYFLIYLRENAPKAFKLLEELESFEDVLKLEKYYSPVKEEADFFIKDFEKNHEVLGKVLYYFFAPKFKVKVPVINYIASKHFEETIIFASVVGDTASFSARNQSGRINVIEVLEEALGGLKNSSSGGHPRAAGGRVHKEDLEKFKQNLLNN